MNIKQRDFYRIDEYACQIRKILRKYSLCANIKPELQKLKEEEAFLKGLHREVRVEMSNLGLNTQEEIVKCINAVEETLIMTASKEMRFGKERRNNGIKSESTYSSKNYESKPEMKYSNKNYESKFCKKHGTCKHDTRECRSLRKEDFKEKKDEHKKDKNFVLREPLPRIGGLEFDGQINKHQTTFLLDPGATKSYLSKKMVAELYVKTTALNEIEKTQIASGSIGNIYEKTSISFNLSKIPDVTFKTDFFVISGNLPFALLGEPFLIQEEVKIDYKEATVRIGDCVIFLDQKYSDWKETPDNDLIEKAFLTTQREDLRRNIVKRFAIKNSVLGTIPGTEFRIELTNNMPINMQPYPIPSKVYESVKNEIQKLEDLNIIRKSKSSFASPAFPIFKKNGRIRLVVDYRKINEVTVKDAHSFPNLWDEIRAIPQCKVFSKLDLSMGYHQMMIKEECRRYTSFVTPFGNMNIIAFHLDHVTL
jgi:hypothetical protein